MARKINRGEILRVVLYTIGVVGVISMALVAPNVVQIFGKLTKNKKRKLWYVNACVKKLKKQNLVKIRTSSRGETVVRLTIAGKRLFMVQQVETIMPPKRCRWDKRWRAIVFDIPESQRWKRRVVRETLKRCGFVHFQHSFWVHPFPCSEISDSLKKFLNLSREVSFVLIEKIDNEARLRKKFRL